jgi:hypothetical protein
MGDAPLGYVETVGGLKVSEDDVVTAGKNDVGPRQSRFGADARRYYHSKSENRGFQPDSNGLLITIHI